MRCTYLHLRVQVLHNFVEAADRAHNALHQLPLLLFVWICARQRQMVQCVSESCAQEAAASQRSIHGRVGWHSLSGAWSMLPSSKCEQPPHSASWSGTCPSYRYRVCGEIVGNTADLRRRVPVQSVSLYLLQVSTKPVVSSKCAKIGAMRGGRHDHTTQTPDARRSQIRANTLSAVRAPFGFPQARATGSDEL